jgi:hypothetical protein
VIVKEDDRGIRLVQLIVGKKESLNEKKLKVK